MKIYKADETLVQILMKHGFIETTSADAKKRNNRTFKLAQLVKREIHFEGDNIILIYDYANQDSQTELTERELKLFLLFFKLELDDLNMLCPLSVYGLKKTEVMLSVLESELESNITQERRDAIKRILKSLDDIKIR